MAQRPARFCAYARDQWTARMSAHREGQAPMNLPDPPG